MNLVADENIDIEIIKGLRDSGYNILSISEDFSGIPDEDVLMVANEHDATLITGDKDFGELVYHSSMEHSGVLLLRLEDATGAETLQVVKHTL